MNKIIPWLVTGGAVLVIAVVAGGYVLTRQKSMTPVAVRQQVATATAVTTSADTFLTNTNNIESTNRKETTPTLTNQTINNPPLFLKKYQPSVGEKQYKDENLTFSYPLSLNNISIYKVSNRDVLASEEKLGQRIVFRVIVKNETILSTSSKKSIFKELDCDAGSEGEYPLTTEGIKNCYASSTAYVSSGDYLFTPEQKTIGNYHADLYSFSGIDEDINIYVIDLGEKLAIMYVNNGGIGGEICANEETKSPKCAGKFDYLHDYFKSIQQSVTFK